MSAPAAAPADPSAQAAPLRVLVADDDPISLRFLADALTGLGARVASAPDGDVALALARGQTFDLLLLDCRMPGAGALQVLQALRDDPQAGSINSAAVATSAEIDPALRRQLLAAGFDEVLGKPCSIEQLRQLLTLHAPAQCEAPLLDDASALAAAGDAATLKALRQLLVQELRTLRSDLPVLEQDPSALRERLHRLRASCGFCGASALAGRASRLQQQMGAAAAPRQAETTRFRQTLDATLAALG